MARAGKPRSDTVKLNKTRGPARRPGRDEMAPFPPSPTGGRGASIQGPLQDAHGAPAGANQGGAPRGSSRIEPSHNSKSYNSGKR